MLRIVGALFALFFLALIALVLAAVLVPTDVYKTSIEEQASESLGREVTVEGKVQLTIFPSILITAGNVQIANAPGFSSKNFVSTEQMRVGVRLLPLFSKRVEITEFILIRPQISLEKLRNNTVNWTIDNPKANKPHGQKSQGFTRRAKAAPINASLGNVRLIDGQATYLDHLKNTKAIISAINLELKMPSLDKELSIAGDLKVDQQAYSIDASLTSLSGFLEGKETPFVISFKGEVLHFDFDGAFLASKDIRFAGALNLRILSLKKLAEIAGTKLDVGQGKFENFSISGQVKGQPDQLSFEQSSLNFDQITGQGDFLIKLTKNKPTIVGNLKIDFLDLNPYLPPVPPPGTGIAPWSKQPLSFQALQAANANLVLNVSTMKMREIEFTDTKLNAILKNGRLEANFKQTSLYGGQGSGRIVLNGRNRKNSLALQASIADVQALALFDAAAGFNRIEGKGRVQFDLLSSGNSIDAMMGAMAGSASLQLQDGAIRGINLAQVLRSAQSFLLTGTLAANDNTVAKTDFSELSGSFNIAKGVARNTDMLMSGPLVRVTGQGQIDLGRQTLDYSLKPRAVASLQGQGGDASLKGLSVPFRLQGPWNNVKAGIDTQALQDRAVKRAKQEASKLIQQNVGGTLGGVLQGFLGTPDAPATDASTDQKPEQSDEEKALGVLGDLLGFGAKQDNQQDNPQPKTDPDQ